MLTSGIFVDNRQKSRQLNKVTPKKLVEERSKLKKLRRHRKTIATYNKANKHIQIKLKIKCTLNTKHS